MSRRSLSVLLGAWVAGLALTLVEGVQRVRMDTLLERLRTDRSILNVAVEIQQFSTWWSLMGAVDVAILVAIALGGARVGGRLGRALVVAASVTAATSLLPTIATLVAPAWAESLAARTPFVVVWVIGFAAVLATRGLSLAIAWRRLEGAARVVGVIAGVFVLGAFAMSVVRWLVEAERSRSLAMASSLLAACAEAGVIGALALARRAAPADAPDAVPGAWSRAAAGVRLYATALRWNVAVAACLYTLLLFAIVGKSPGLLSTLAWIGAPAQALAAIALAAALHRLGHVPDRAAAAWAWTALGAVLAGLAVQLFALVEARAILRLLADTDGFGPDRESLVFHAGVLRKVEAASVIVGLGGAIAVVLALRAIAVARGHVALVSRATALAIGVAVSTAFAVGVRWMLSDPEAAARRPVPTLLVAALAVVAALSILIAVISFVDALGRALDEQVIGSA